MYGLGGNTVVCPKICFVSDVKIENASAPVYAQHSWVPTATVRAQTAHQSVHPA